MAVIGWARISTTEQDLSAQVEALKMAGAEKIFQHQHSGASEKNREALSGLVDYAREGDVVLTAKLDRLGRSLSQILETIEALHVKGVAVRTLDGAFDSSNENPWSRAMMQIAATFSELDRALIVQRMQEGRKRTGRRGGRGGKGIYLPEEDRAEIRKRLAAGESKVALAKAFSVSRATILNIQRE